MALVVGAAIFTLLAGFGVTRLSVDSGIDTLVDSESEAFTATESVRQSFGEDPVVILIEGDLTELLSAPNILRILNLEACLAGNVPEEAEPLPGPCGELAELQPAKLVSGPATFLNQAAVGITNELARRFNRARKSKDPKAQDRFFRQAIRIAARYGLTGIPSLGDPAFTRIVVFDPERSPGTPKARLSYLFPAADAAQIIVRLRPDLTAAERERALELIAEAAAETHAHERCAAPGSEDPQPCFALSGGNYVVSGAPVVIDALAGELKRSLIILLVVAIILMAIVLPAVLRSAAPLVPGVVALAAAVTTFGVYGIAGGRLTIAAIAVLPILVGLAVDYTIQTQSRFDEAIDRGGAGGRSGSVREGADAEAIGAGRPADVVAIAADAARAGAPTLACACLATAAGFAVLAFSPIPMVRGFGLILAIGVIIAFAYALVVGTAALTMRERFHGRRHLARGGSERIPGRQPTDPTGESLREAALTLPSTLAAILRRARDRGAASVASWRKGWLRTVAAAPGRVLLIAVLLAGLGWGLGTRTGIVSEISELMPPGLEQVADLHTLQDATDVSGELDVIVTAPDLVDPELIAWMAGLKRRVLEHGGYGGKSPSCEEAVICPGPSLTDFIADAERGVERDRVLELVAALPSYDLQAVAEVDAESGELGNSANIAFMIKLMPLDEQQRLIEMIDREIKADGGPPSGVEVRVGGLPVIAAETASALAESRYWLTLAALAAIALVLILAMRSLRWVTATLGPILLATGWSSLMLFVLGVPLNPVSAVLGVMVVAISTEFSVILSSRYRQERSTGADPAAALERSYATSGAAVLASGVTVIVGFAALVASKIPMLRDFGLVTVVDLAVSLAGVMLLLPALLILSERAGRRRSAEKAEYGAS